MFVEEKKQGEVKELDAASQLLLKAADLIEEEGWCRGMLRDSEGNLCLRGALIKAAGYMPTTWDGMTCVLGVSWGEVVDRPGAYSAILTADERLGRYLGSDPAHWNNVEAGSKDVVIAKLRAVALSGQC